MSARVGATHVSDDPPYSPPASNLKATLDGLAMVARRSYTGSPRTGPPSPPHCAPVLFNGGSPPTSASTSPDSAAASSSSSSAAAVFSALAGPALATLGAPTGPGRSLSMNSIPVLESVTPPAEALIPPALRRVPSAGEPPLCQTPLALCEGGPLESLAVDGPCVLYTDIPFLSRFFRLFGHVAVTNSDRTRVYELRAWPWFPSNNSVWVLEGDTPSSAARGFLRPILFGRPSKCLPLGVPPELYAAYDAALEDELQTWRTRMHMGVGSNCHSFICDALNNMHRRAGGTGSPYTILRLGAAVYAHAIPVRRRAPRGLVYGALSDAGKVWQSFVESVMGLHVRFQRGARRQLNWVPGQSVVPLVGALVSPLLKLCYEVTTPTVAGGRGNSNSNYCDGAAAAASSYSASSAASAAGSDAEAGSDDAGASDGSHRVHSGNDSDQAVRVDAWGRLRRTPMADAAVLATVNEGANEGSHDEDDDDDGGEGSDDGYEDESKGDDTSAGRRTGRRPLLSQRHSRSRSHDHSPYYGRTGSRAFMGPTAADIAAATADCGSAEGVPLTGLGVLQAHDSPQWHRRRQSSTGGIGGDGPCTKECCAAPLNSTFRGNDGTLLCDKECCAGDGNTAYARYYHSTSGHSRSSSVGAVALDSAAAAAAAAAVAGVLGSSACRDGKDCAECNRTAHSQPAHGHDSLCNEAKSNSSSRRLSLGSSTGVGTDGGSSNGTCCSTGNTAAQKQEQRQEQRQEQGQGQGQRLGQGQSKGFCWCEECTLAVASSSNNSKDSPPLTGRVVSVKGSYAPAAFPPFTNACNEVVTGTGTGDIAGGTCSGVDCWCDTLSGPSAGAHYARHHKHGKTTVNGSTAAAAAAGGLGPGGDTADGCGVSGGVSTSDRSFLHSVSESDNSSHPHNLDHHDDDDDDGDDGDGEAGLDSAGGVRGRNGRRHSSGDAVSGTYSRGVW